MTLVVTHFCGSRRPDGVLCDTLKRAGLKTSRNRPSKVDFLKRDPRVPFARRVVGQLTGPNDEPQRQCELLKWLVFLIS